MSDETPVDRPQPAGLGGWLWPVTWVSAVLPVLLTASVAASLPHFIEYLRQSEASTYPMDHAWVYRAYGFNVLQVLASWWWALRWFARDPHLPQRGPLVLLMLGVLCAILVATDRHPADYRVLAASLLGFAITAFICVRVSKRIRNTFVAGALPVGANEFDTAVFNGPLDWSRGYWLLPGALAYAVFGLFPEWLVLADVAWQALPPPHPADPANDGCGHGMAVVGNGYSLRQIEAYRVALTISLAAGLLLASAVAGFARGARWTPWAAIAALALAMIAPMGITFGKWCSPYVDGPDFREMWQEWGVVLMLLIIATGYRRWSTSTKRT